MPKDLNNCQFIGRLGKDIELKYATSGNAIANFSIACSDDYKGKSGQKVEQTNWVNIVMFGRLAEIAGQYLSKGSQIYVSGKLTTRKWQAQDGTDRYSAEIIASEMQMLGGGSSSDQRNHPNNAAPSQSQQQPSNQANSFDEDEDLPF